MAERRDGDWDCPDCGALCFASKETCFKCDRAAQGPRPRQEGDWDCPDCGAMCFASRETCFKCDRQSGGGRPRKEGDWDCPDCGALVFEGRESCFKCDRNNGVNKRPRKEGDWDCGSCGALVFEGRLNCFKCGAGQGAGPGAKRGGGKGGGKGRGAAAELTPGDAVKALAKVSKDFRKAWVGYCKKYGEGVNNPAEHEEEFLTGFADYTASLLTADMEPKPAAGKKRAGEAGDDGEAPAKKKVTMKKAVAETIKRLNGSGGLLAPIRLAAVAAALAQLDESAALKSLALLEEQQEDVEDPNEFLKNQVTFALEGAGEEAAPEEEAYPW